MHSCMIVLTSKILLAIENNETSQPVPLTLILFAMNWKCQGLGLSLKKWFTKIHKKVDALPWTPNFFQVRVPLGRQWTCIHDGLCLVYVIIRVFNILLENGVDDKDKRDNTSDEHHDVINIKSVGGRATIFLVAFMSLMMLSIAKIIRHMLITSSDMQKTRGEKGSPFLTPLWQLK